MILSANSANSRRSVAGFTLLEVMIVIAIFGILAAIGFPTLMKWIPNYQLKAAVQEMYGDLQKAKMDAIKTNSRVTTTFTDDPACPPAGGGGYTFTNDESGQVIASVSFSKGICLHDPDNPFAPFAGFNSRGLPRGAVGSITLKHAKITRKYTISQSLSGAIRVQ